jgi:hypothetical protein
MPQLKADKVKRGRTSHIGKSKSGRTGKPGTRYSVGLPAGLASEVEHYAKTADASISKAIATLVRIGLETQASRKREFFKRLRENLAQDDPQEQDRLVDEFRDLILGR